MTAVYNADVPLGDRSEDIPTVARLPKCPDIELPELTQDQFDIIEHNGQPFFENQSFDARDLLRNFARHMIYEGKLSADFGAEEFVRFLYTKRKKGEGKFLTPQAQMWARQDALVRAKAPTPRIVTPSVKKTQRTVRSTIMPVADDGPGTSPFGSGDSLATQLGAAMWHELLVYYSAKGLRLKLKTMSGVGKRVSWSDLGWRVRKDHESDDKRVLLLGRLAASGNDGLQEPDTNADNQIRNEINNALCQCIGLPGGTGKNPVFRKGGRTQIRFQMELEPDLLKDSQGKVPFEEQEGRIAVDKWSLDYKDS